MASIQDFYSTMASSAMQTPNSPYAKSLDANAAFLMPFFNMPSQKPGANVQTPADPKPATQTPTTRTTAPPATQTPTQTVAQPLTDLQKAEKQALIDRGATYDAMHNTDSKQISGKSGGLSMLPPPGYTYTSDRPPSGMMWAYKENGERVSVPSGYFANDQSIEADMFSMFGIDKTDPNALYDQFGLERPEYEKPSGAEYDALVQQQKELSDIDRRDELQANYENEVKNITAMYETKREELTKQVENSRNEQISGLYSIGVVNPLSSGLASIGTASEEFKRKQEGLLAQEEAAQKQLAYARYFDLDTKEIERRLNSINSAITAQNEQAQAEYDARVADFDRGVQLVDKLVNVWKENNRVEEKQRADAQDAFNDLVKNFGSGAFNGMDAAQLSDLEAALGYPTGSLQSGITALKKEELKNESMELRTIGGNLYSIERDAEGNIVPKLIIAKPAGSGGSGSTTDKELSQMFDEADQLRDDLASGKIDWGQAYQRIAREFPQFNEPDASGRTAIDDALGGSAGYDPATGTFDSSKATGYAREGQGSKTLTDEDVISLYGAAYDYDKGKLDTSKIPSDVRQEVITRYPKVAPEPEKKKDKGIPFVPFI